MKRICIIIFYLALLTGCYGCWGARPAAPYVNADQALLVGKVECLTSGWFGDKRQRAKLYLYRLNIDGSRTYINKITSDYTVLALQPGLYGLDKSYFNVVSGLIYTDAGYWVSEKPSYDALFTQSFWALTSIEQSIEVGSYTPDFFGVIKVEAGDVLYYGDLTLDMVSTRSWPMFIASYDENAARQALAKEYPTKVLVLKKSEFIGSAFTLGKIRQSRL